MPTTAKIELEDLVNHPNHYNQGRIEVIEYIEDCLGLEGTANYCLGNVLKYISRADYKGNKLQDLQKALWYLNRAVEYFEFLEEE